MEKKKITKDMTISDVLQNYPEVAEVFFEHGLHCVGCMAAQFENIEEAAQVHSIDLDKLLDDLNKKVEESNKN